MSARPRSRKAVETPDEHPDERWMASYMDMVTVLMCMFIVLFAMSTVDQEKFEALKNSLATGFGTEASESIDTTNGVVVPPELISKEEDAEGFTDITVAQQEVDELREIQARITANLEANGVEDLVRFKIDDRGLTIGLVGSETFFQPDLADLSSSALVVLDSVAPVIAPDTREVSIEGHADRHGRTVNFPTDWELSSGRATQVLRRLVESGGVGPERVAAVGYGSARPTATGDGLEDMAMNRRVDLVVLSELPESVRALIPGIVSDSTASASAAR
ncbi:flagellar motor protein MotB [Leifsonia sp. A12D58]|uniref:OmpA/MotB family protein n=1 Tax=Leifsonia sp. A12D58 TaxID=3397674 RepID=UPI0039E0038E